MPLMLMKLAVAAETVTDLHPKGRRFFYITEREAGSGKTITIPTNSFFDHTGATVTALPELDELNDYTRLYINGVLQMDDVFRYTPGQEGNGSLTITVPDNGAILPGNPIVLELIQHKAASVTHIQT